METICISCNARSFGMISIYRHPSKLDEMFSYVCDYEILPEDCLCIQCYDDLKSAYAFKNKVNASCETRKKLEGEVRRKISDIRLEEEISKKQIEYEVVITSTSNNDESEMQTERLIETVDDAGKIQSIAELDVNEILPNSNIHDKSTVVDIIEPEKIIPKKTKRNVPSQNSKQVNRKSLQSVKIEEEKETKEDATESEPEKSIAILYQYNLQKNTEFTIIDPDTGKEVLLTQEQDSSEHKVEEYMTKRHECRFCDKKFRSRTALQGHHRIHTGERPYKCDACDKSFAEQGNLRQHVRSIHLNIRAFTCEKCQQSFKTHYSHKVHQRSCITKERPYVCQICEKAFYSSGKLLIHNRIHTGERPYPCQYCSSAFKDKTALKRHAQRIHSSEIKQTKSEDH